ncbi:MAG TPA: TIGR02556 family CRISPR-associated protein [Thermoplasmatales archaeon]|nr:TIGR02556 family CRISPR-associated protein [Thermoplasmatales archaeon]
MIEAIKEIGDYVRKKENKSEIEIFSDKAKLTKKTKKVLCIFLHKENGEYHYKKVIPEKYSPDKMILYRGGSSRGTDILPSSIITEINKTFENKIIKWFEKKEEKELKKIEKVLENNKEKILEELSREYENLHKNEKNNVLLTIKIEENDKEKHLGEIEIFRNILVEDTVKRYYFLKSIGESKGTGICYLCNTQKEVYGFVLPSFGFSFATADKCGFMPSFIQTDHWKDIPICENCAISLEIGKRFLDEHLNFPKKNENNFFGCRYYVIPKFIFKEMFDELYRYIEFFKDKEYEEGLLSKEDWLEKTLEEKEDILRLIFVFYTQKGGGKYIDIVQYVEDVLPSWIRRIDNAQKNIRKMRIFQEDNIKKILGRKWVGDFVTGLKGEKGLNKNNWYAVFARSFFPYSKTHGVYDKQFRDIIGFILSNKKVDRDFVIPAFIREIKETVKKKEGKRDYYKMKVLCLKAFMFYLFLKELNLFRGEKMEEKIEEKDIEENRGKFEEKIDNFFKEYCFDDPAKKAAFSVGMLVDYLLWVQRTEKKSEFGQEPFWSKLHGLVLDERKMKNIFREAIAKLRQYRKTFPSLEKIAGKYLAEAEGKWKLSQEEISYYFALGMTLRNIFSFEKNEKSNGGE